MKIPAVRSSTKFNNLGLFVFVMGCPAAVIFLTNYILRGGVFITIDYLRNKLDKIVITYIPLLLITVIITFIFRRVSPAYILLGGISFIGAGAHYYKMFYRGEVLWPSDIVFFNATGNIVNEFDITLTLEMKEAIFLLAIITAISHIFVMPKFKGRYLYNLAGAALSALLLMVDLHTYVLNIDFYESMYTFNFLKSPADIYYRNTFHTAFAYYINTTITIPPDNYSEENVKNIIDAYQSDEEKEQTKPDIILILAESFFQPDKLFGLNFSENISENYDKIAQTGVYGKTIAYKYGGGTGEIEFGCMNQINISMFADGISYMNTYGNNELPSFVHMLKENGYETHAMHAHTDVYYNRRSAYRNMGIDNMIFSDEFEYNNTLGRFIDDESNVKQIIAEYEFYLQNSDKENVFIVDVSMQNHMPMEMAAVQDNMVQLLDEGYSNEFTDGMSVVATYQKKLMNP